MAAGELHAREHEGGAAVGGGADLEQAQRIGHHRRCEHLFDGHLLAVPGIGVGHPGPGVLDLHRREVVLGGPEQLHAPTCVQREVRGVGGTEKVEAQPVGVVAPLAPDRCEETLGGGVGPDHESDVAQAGQDLGARRRDGGGTRRARRVGARDAGARPAQRLGEGGTRDEPRVSVADGVGPRHELDVGPRHPGIGEHGARRRQPVLDEVASPLPPRVHADPEDGHAAVVRHLRPPIRPSPAAISTPGTRARRPRRARRSRARPRCPPSGRRR